MPASATARRRLEAQGFCDLEPAAWDEQAPWMRWSPALCTVVVGVALASPPILWTMAGVALLGAAFPFHPFDLLYNHGVRHLTNTRPLPRQGPQRRFACAVATAWLLATGWAFHAGLQVAGYALGAAIVLVGGLVATTHFCIASLVYNTLFPRRPWTRRPS